jgi:hypothetical protein
MTNHVKRQVRAPGEVRQSQMLTTYGPGALVDLPRHAVIIGGLEGWSEVGRQPIIEERLVEKLRPHFNGKTMGLFTPPADDATTAASAVPSGVTVWQFPRWFVAQYEDVRPDGSRSRPLVLQTDLVDGGFRNADRKKPWPVVPIRFVQACVNGHIDDINWRYFVHGNGDSCRRQLWIDERGTSGDFTEIYIRCECSKPPRSLASAKGEGAPLGMCRGRRPWIGPNDYEKCDKENRILVRHASNAYFSQVLSVIHIPDSAAALKKAVDAVWVDYLQYCDSTDDVKKERKKQKVIVAIEEHDDDQVFAEILRRKGQKPVEDKSVKHVEVETLMAQVEHLVDDVPDSDFYASAWPKPTAKAGVMAKVEKIVLVHRLREVKAQLGFTRFEGGTTTEEGELDLPVGLAHLAAEPTWLPAIENRGEGVFIAFKPGEVQKWLDKKQVDARAHSLAAGYKAWADSKGKAPKPYSPVYAMLHSLSHLLVVAVSLECGYPSSAIRERVYATKAGLGILLYTGTSDAEGTLGGLVNVGRHIDHHLKTALDLGRLCSNDPVCAQHRPDNAEEGRFLHGAACHGCVLISEHSCEMRNEFLDRALVVPTVAGLGSAFFETP